MSKLVYSELFPIYNSAIVMPFFPSDMQRRKINCRKNVNSRWA